MKFIIILSCLFLFSCAADDNKTIKNNDVQEGESKLKHIKQLNIHVLLDLSDRIDTMINPEKPEHYKRDILIINHLAGFFVNDMSKKGTYQSKGKMRISFYPRPDDPNINILAGKLNVDVADMDVKQKKDVHDHLAERFTENITRIYRSALDQHQWVGSDIWRFFKNDVKDYCIEKDTNYRNILIILTDGYVFHEDSKEVASNRYAYVLPRLLKEKKLRNNHNWRAQMDKLDFGLITSRNDLQNLEVLVLEVSPAKDNKDDEDILKAVWAKWFTEMRVKRFAIYNSDLPEYTRQRITDFLQ